MLQNFLIYSKYIETYVFNRFNFGRAKPNLQTSSLIRLQLFHLCGIHTKIS